MALEQTFDTGPGTGGVSTMRVIPDSGSPSIPTIAGGQTYKTVAVSQTDFLLGASGAVGDYLEGLLCVVATAANSQVQVRDGNASSFVVLPNNVGPGIGSYYIPLGLKAVNVTTPGWKISTGSGVTVVATGTFT
jgi:hypothetical protein